MFVRCNSTLADLLLREAESIAVRIDKPELQIAPRSGLRALQRPTRRLPRILFGAQLHLRHRSVHSEYLAAHPRRMRRVRDGHHLAPRPCSRDPTLMDRVDTRTPDESRAARNRTSQ